MNEGSGPSLFKNSKIPKIFGSQRCVEKSSPDVTRPFLLCPRSWRFVWPS
jgi:hypothetical protein